MNRGSPLAIEAAHIVDKKVDVEARVDRVTQDSADSFPASDPPSWTPLQVGAPIEDSSRPAQARATDDAEGSDRRGE